MTPKHKQAIRNGIKKLRERRRRSAAMIESWKRRRNNAIANAKVTIVEHKPKQVESLGYKITVPTTVEECNKSAPEVRNNATLLTSPQLIAYLCRKHQINEFELGQLDDLVCLCEAFHDYRKSETD